MDRGMARDLAESCRYPWLPRQTLWKHAGPLNNKQIGGKKV